MQPAQRRSCSRVGRFVLSLAVAVLVGAGHAHAQAPDASTADGEWPQFMGPQRNGISSETGLLVTWPAGGPRVSWRVSGGVGMSGIAVRAGRAVTLVQREGRQWLVGLDANNGQTLWQADLAPAYQNAMGNGPRATPCIAGGKVFALTGEGVLAAVDLRDGRRLWSVATLKELGGQEAEYGMASSPLVAGNVVIVTVGAERGTVAAFDVGSGQLRWTAGQGPAGYSSPVLRRFAAGQQVVAFCGRAALGLDPTRGTVLWQYPFDTNYDCNIALPIEIQGRIFLSAGEDHGSALLDVRPAGDGFEVQPVWESLGSDSVLRSEWQTPLYADGYLYGMDNVGGAGPITHLTCIDAATGERKWQQARFGKGNLIAADGKLFLTTMKGELIVARMSSERYEELGRMTVLGSTRQAPALAGRRLYVRDERDIVCIDVAR
ncbi:MAG: PQQ-binding-like beta-propeller repeat protein [Pirellulaceae bacterium]